MIFSQVIDFTIDGGDERELCHGHPEECKLKAVYLVPATTLAVDATNHQTLTVKKGVAGTALGLTTSDVGETYEAAYTKGVAQAITLTATGLNLEFGATDTLEIVVAEGGTCAALDSSIVIVWEVIRVP